MRAAKRIAVALLVLASMAYAGPLKTEQVAGDANAVCHLDVEAMVQTEVGKWLIGEAEKDPNFLNGIAARGQDQDLDFAKNVRGITFYGNGNTIRKGVAILDMTAASLKTVEALARLFAGKSHKEVQYGSHTLHEWRLLKWFSPEDGDIYGSVYDDKTAVFASSLGKLKLAIDVLDGKAESLAKTKGLPMLPKPIAGQFLVGVICSRGGESGASTQKQSEKKVDVSIQAGENKQGVFAELVAAGDDELRADMVRSTIGLTGTFSVHFEAANRKDLVLTGNVTVDGVGKVTKVSVAMPTDSLIGLIKCYREKGNWGEISVNAKAEAAGTVTLPLPK